MKTIHHNTRKSLEKQYFDPAAAGSYSGQAVFRKHSATAQKLRGKELKQWLRTQETYLHHFPVKKKFKRNRVLVYGVDEQWQGDLVDLSSLADLGNKGTRYLLTVIDVLSKHAWVQPLKTKCAVEVTSAFEKILRRSNRTPNWYTCDAGKEFVNKPFQAMLKRHKIGFYIAPAADVKACIAERFNRTLKNKMWRYFSAKGTFRFLDVLPKLVSSYNNTYHSAIKMTPSSVTIAAMPTAWENLYRQTWPGRVKKWVPLPMPPKYKFQLGDQVKLSKDKALFDKGYLPNWTSENFTIVQRLPRDPPVYRIANAAGEKDKKTIYFEPELLKVETTSCTAKTRRKRK